MASGSQNMTTYKAKQLVNTYGSDTKPVYINAGVPTILGTIGANNKPVWVNAGVISTLTTIGGTTKPVWVNNGVITEMTAGTTAQFYRGDKTWSNTLTGGIEIKGHIAGDSGTAGHGLYSGGAYHNAYNNIILHGDASTGSSGIAFVSDKGSTTINQPSDRAFIQYHAHGVTTYTAEGTAPTLATTGELGIFVIGIGNDDAAASRDEMHLQTNGHTSLLHRIAASAYVIPDTGNTTGTVGGGEQPIYSNGGVLSSTSYALKATINNGNSAYVAYYSGDRAISSAKSTTGMIMPAHYYHNLYNDNPTTGTTVYVHYYNSGTTSTNTFANLRVKSGSSYKVLAFGGDGALTWGGTMTASGTITANGGYLKSTLNSNTVTIGSANTSWCHIENSANIPFYFNKAIHVNGDVYYYNTKVHMSSSGFHPPKNGGIYWDPYVESASDASDVTSIYQIASGVAGGTELRINQQNDSGDVINICAPYYIYLNSKRAFTINDSWLRINENAGFSSGTYFGSTTVRTDGTLQVGSGGANFYANNSGNGYFSNTLGIAGTNTGYKLYVNGTVKNTGRLYQTNWIEFTDKSGLYLPSSGSGTHFYPANDVSYGSFQLGGTKGGYFGITMGNNNNYMTCMSNGNDCGLYTAANGFWGFYYHRDNKRCGIAGSSTTANYACQVNGALYVTSNLHVTGNTYIGSGHAGGYLNGGATNGGINSIFLGDDVWLGDCNAAGIMGMKSTSSNCGFYMYNSGGTQIGQLYFNGTNLVCNKTISANLSGSVTGHASSDLALTGGTVTGHTIFYTQSAGNAAYADGSAIEIREVACVGTSQNAWTYAPKIGFHWGGRYQGTFGLHSNGQYYLSLSSSQGNATLNTGATWGGSVLINSNWIGFYNAQGGSTRYGYIQTDANRMYFRKENGVSSYAFDFSGALLCNSITSQITANSPAVQISPTTYANTGLYQGNGDGNGNGTANIAIRSWYGVGFMNGCTNAGTNGAITAGVDCRTGYMYAYSFQNRSSRLVKEHIYSLPLEKAKRILLSRPVGFDFKPEFGGMKNQYGLIAEELETIIPELVTVPTTIGGYKTIDYVKIVPFLIRVIQEHEREIEELKRQLNI